MDWLREALSRGSSRKSIDELVEAVAQSPRSLEELFVCIRQDTPKVAWHAAWVTEKLHEQYPHLFSIQMLDDVVVILLQTNNDSIRRHLLCILRLAELPDELSVDLINKAFEWIVSEKTAVAVKSLSIHYLLKVCSVEKDLLPELHLTVSHVLESCHNPAIRSAAKQVFKVYRPNE